MKADLKKMTVAQLWEGLKKALQHTAEGIREAADYWVELMTRGEDLSAYRNAMFAFLPDVANGKLMPDVLLQYGGKSSHVQAVGSLVPEIQKKLSQPDATVTVLNRDGSTAEKRITELHKYELPQVFVGGRVLTPNQQKRHMVDRPITKKQFAELDVTPWATPKQRQHIINMADAAGMLPAEWIMDALVRFKQVDPASAKKRTAAGPSAHAGV